MSVPGSNLYKTATQIISKSNYTLFNDVSRTLDARGIWVTSYGAGIPLRDSIQAIPRSIYAQIGLDFDKYYIMIYTDNPLLVVERGTSGDQIVFNNSRFQLLDNTDWVPMDGWSGVVAVLLQPETSP